MKNSLMVRLLPLFILLASIPVLSGLATHFIAKGLIKNYIGQGLQLQASTVISELEEKLLKQYQNVLAWSKHESLQAIAANDAGQTIQSLLNHWGDEQGKDSHLIIVVNREGKIIASNRPGMQKDVSKTLWFQNLIQVGRPVIEDLGRSRIFEPYSLTFAAPIVSQKNPQEILGAIAQISSGLDILSQVNNLKLFNAEEQSPEGYALLIDKQGRLLTQPFFEKNDWMLKKNLLSEGFFALNLPESSSEGYFIQKDLYGNPAFVAYASSRGLNGSPGFGWTVLLILKTSKILAPMDKLTYQIVVFGIVAVILIFLMSKFLAKNVSAPISKMANVANAIAEGDFSQKVWMRSHDEVSELANSLNKMADRLSKARSELTQAKEYTDSMILSTIDTLLAMDHEGKITLCNPAALQLLGYEEHELVGQPLESVIAPDDYKKSQIGELLRPDAILEVFAKNDLHDQRLASRLIRRSVANMEMNYKTRKGQLVPMLVSAALIREPSGKMQGLVAIAKDITEQKEAANRLKKIAEALEQSNKLLESKKGELEKLNMRLEELSLVDPLTELANRRRLQHALSHESEHAKRNGTNLLGVLIDLDDFKKVNDSLGHAVGDIVLKECAVKIKKAVRTSDIIARVGGDEFVVLLPHTRIAEGMVVAERLRTSLSEFPIMITDSNVTVTASIGIVELDQDVKSIDELLVKTHAALKRSKGKGKNKVSYGWAESEKTIGEDIQSQFLEILKNKDLIVPARQPIVSTINEKILGYELLTRINLPGLENPETFFYLSREANMLTSMDHECFKRCLKSIRPEESHLRFQVNLFPTTLLAVPPLELLKDIPEHHPKNKICIEISEKQIVGNPAHILETIQVFKSAGILIAIDDVGYGNSCLESLIILEPDVVKIDKGWVKGISKDNTIYRALKRILSVLLTLEVEIIAEGIENAEDFKVIQDLGVAHVQGFYLGKPV